jgi:hypothetical protein
MRPMSRLFVFLYAFIQLNQIGYWTSAYLPITRLHFGGTSKGSLQHTLGKIECEGKAKSEGMPKSCEDLWRMGHTLNGIFAVKGSKSIESLYCDFNRRPNENGIEYRVLNFIIFIQ